MRNLIHRLPLLVLIAFFLPSQPKASADILDDSWTMTVNGQSVQVNADGTWRISNVSAPDLYGPEGPGSVADFISDDYVRIVGHSTKGSTNRYAFSEFFQIRQRAIIGVTNFTFTDVPPRKAESLSIVLSNRIAFVGQPLQLAVLARPSDGASTNVASHLAWTTYRVSNTNIAMVSPDGVVLALIPGIVYVTAVNEGVSTVCGLSVVTGIEGLTTIIGTVIGTNGVPIAGAVVRVSGLPIDAVVTDASGGFSIAAVPTTFGPLDIIVRTVLNGTVFTATARVDGVSGGVTPLGVLMLKPVLAPTIPRFAGGETSLLPCGQMVSYGVGGPVVWVN